MDSMLRYYPNPNPSGDIDSKARFLTQLDGILARGGSISSIGSKQIWRYGGG